MERLVYKDGNVWRHTGRAVDHITVLNAANDLYRAKLQNPGRQRKHRFDMRAIWVCWNSGLLNLTHLSSITGVTRLTLRRWLGDDGYVRPRGSLNPEHLPVLLQYMQAMTRTRYSQVSAEFLRNLAAEGTKHGMSSMLLGINQDREVAISYVSDDVLPGVRPHDPGHPVQGEGGVAPGYTDQTDDGPGEGQGQPEPDHPRELQGPAPRPTAPESSPAEIERVLAQHRRVDAAKRREDFGPPVVGEDWHPLEDFEPDKDGDSLLERGTHTPGSGLLAGVPIADRWEQDTPES